MGNVDQTEVDALVQNISYSEETLTFNYSDIYGNPLPHGNVLPANYQSYFRLSIPGLGTTGDLLFDITNAATLATTAADIQRLCRTSRETRVDGYVPERAAPVQHQLDTRSS